MARKNDTETATETIVETPEMIEKKPSRKEMGQQRTKIDDVQGNWGTLTKCQRSNETGDIELAFELDGQFIRVTVNPIVNKVKGRIIPMN